MDDTTKRARIRRDKPTTTPPAAPADHPRRFIIPGLETPCGGPVLAVATGHPRRPVLTALASFATLAVQRAEGGAA